MFAVLLVSLAAISLLLSAGTETALAGNYRSSASAYYAASAGLEEARGRLLSKNPDFFNNTFANFIPTAGTPQLAVGQVRYITNPIAAENVLTVYPDTEYDLEFGAGSLAAASGAGNVKTIPSVSTVTSGGTTYQGPLFKWVRINPATEKSINVDVDNDGNGNDSTTPLYYDPAHLDAGGNPSPSLIVSAAPPSTAFQVFEVTSLAVLPNGSQKLLQYVVTPATLSLKFPSALTLNSNNASMHGGNWNGYGINGQDQCNAAALPLPAIGYNGGGATNYNNIKNGLPLPYRDNYIGAGAAPPNPSVVDVAGSLSPSLQTPASLDALVQLITQNADAVITPASGTHADPGDLPSGMSPTHPMTVVVNGDYSQSGGFTGYGLLVVTGNFKFTADSGWRGTILVIGQGKVNGDDNGGNEFDGAIFVAKTRDALGNELAALGQATFGITPGDGGGSGINYNSCWINSAQPVLSYKALSYREIGQ
jgi:hypothetical protein